MSLHDAYARVTPFEIAFPNRTAADRLAHEVMTEATSRGVDPQLPGVFVSLGAVGDVVRELTAPGAPEDAAHELGALLFHAVHFERAGRPVFLLETATSRYLVEGAPTGVPKPPEPAGYLQLPQHLFWMDAGAEGAAESIDGMFWFASEAGVLHVLPITGVLPERMAFRALPLAEAPMHDAARWLDAEVREGGADYSSSLPGHDLDRLYSMRTAGEVLKLVARFFSYTEDVPEARLPVDAEAAEAQEGGAPAHAHAGPRPSSLPYTRVKLVA